MGWATFWAIFCTDASGHSAWRWYRRYTTALVVDQVWREAMYDTGMNVIKSDKNFERLFNYFCLFLEYVFTLELDNICDKKMVKMWKNFSDYNIHPWLTTTWTEWTRKMVETSWLIRVLESETFNFLTGETKITLKFYCSITYFNLAFYFHFLSLTL
jgi:hypothetical protein